MSLLVPDPLTLHPQSVIIKGPLYLVAGLDRALHPGKRVWFPMEMLVRILGLGRYYADCIAAQVQTVAEIAKHSYSKSQAKDPGAMWGAAYIVLCL